MPNFYKAEIGDAYKAYFSAIFNNDELSNNYFYSCYNLDEIAILAKSDEQAKDECIARLGPAIRMFCLAKVKRDIEVDYEDIYLEMQLACGTAIDIYNPELGKFLSLVLTVFKFRYLNIRKLDSRNYRNNLILKESLRNNMFLSDNQFVENYHEIEFKIDFDKFYETQKDEDKEIILLYKQGIDLKAIAKTLNKPYSTVAYHINKINEDFKKYINRKC